MAESIFTFEGNPIIIQCNKNQKMKDICNKLSTKINMNINSLIFLYGGSKLNLDKTFNELTKEDKINILVYEGQGFELEKKKNRLQLSMKLIKKFKEMSDEEESEDKICEFIQQKGLPMDVSNAKILALILYFHKLCVPFYNILNSLNKDKILKKVLLLLKKSYYLFADTKCQHYNYKSIAEKVFPKLKSSEEESLIYIELNQISLNENLPETPSVFTINQNILELGLESHGKLDIYTKIHILKALITFINLKKLVPYIKDFEQMENDLIKLYRNSQGEKLTEKKYIEYVKIFTDSEKREEWAKIISSCKIAIRTFQTINDIESIKFYEKLFIQLLGHIDREIRNDAVKILNIIYDQTTWQDKSPFPLENTKIQLLGEELNLELVINIEEYKEKNIVLILSSPCENKNINYTVTTFIKCQNEEEEDDTIKLRFNLGKLSKCGYYDWYLALFSKGKYSNVKIIKNKNKIEGKGRSIVLNKDVKNLSIHEVFPDLINAEIDKNKGKFIKRGNFKSLENKLYELHNRFINCLYIIGALERDNSILYDEETGKPLDIANANASPMSIIKRDSISSLLGGDDVFKSLLNKAKSLNMKVIIDSLCRISSSNFNIKYRKVLLRYLDERNQLQLYYGSVGKSINYKDSTILNYRKIEAWEILINEIKTIIKKFNIDGIHLDNCQMWPNIMEVNMLEMYRIDNDGTLSYSPMEILNGEIIIPNSEGGYWETDNCEDYANPLLVKLTKEIWNEYPEFIFLGECGLEEKFSQPFIRHASLVKSGIIPRMYTLPAIICQMLGKKILYNGNIESVPPENVSIIKEWYKEHYQNLPEGAILVQSSGGLIWPYPALLYGRGNLVATDLLFTLPDVPMTFMNEIDGEAYRVQIINIFTSRESKKNIDEKINNKGNIIKTRSNSLKKLLESMWQEETNKKLTNFKLALNDFLATNFNASDFIYSIINLSDVNLKNVRDIDNKQYNLEQSLKQQGLDLTKIRYRYDQRREMRKNHNCLKVGELVYLNAYDNYNSEVPGILAFARKTPEETGIFAINFREKETNFFLDLSNLFEEEDVSSSICYTLDWINNNKVEYQLLEDVVKSPVFRIIGPYDTIAFGLYKVPFNDENFQKVIETKKNRKDDGLIPMTFRIKIEKRIQPTTVLICGSFSDWKEKIPLNFDPFSEKWFITLRLPKGKHLYKYIIDNIWEINPTESHERGNDGIENNFVIL